MKSLLPFGGGNLFQILKGWRTNAEAEGIDTFSCAIGQPSGAAFKIARRIAAKAIMSDDESMHEYQDNGSPGCPNFAEHFCNCHVDIDVFAEKEAGKIATLPIPGIKPMLGPVIASCGGMYKKIGQKFTKVMTMTNPGYGTPAFMARALRGVKHFHAPMDPKFGFLFTIESLHELDFGYGDIIMLNFPHNPTGIVATKDWLNDLCDYCEQQGIRIFNDGAYAALVHDNSDKVTTLTDVAINYPNLSWAEAFSASKSIGNGTGWRIGAINGSPDCVGDIAKIKGEWDSGFTAPQACGVVHTFLHHRDLITANQQMYQQRMDSVIDIATKAGFRLAVEPKAGFFVLFDAPNAVFGERVTGAEQVNKKILLNTGLIGVHFDPYYRLAVCGPVENNLERIADNLNAAKPEYDS
jgi:aspartate/methionine/tyrosine aminotransferase